MKCVDKKFHFKNVPLFHLSKQQEKTTTSKNKERKGIFCLQRKKPFFAQWEIVWAESERGAEKKTGEGGVPCNSEIVFVLM